MASRIPASRTHIPCRDIVAIGDDILPPHRSLHAASLRGCAGEIEDVLFLPIAGGANADAEQRYSGAYAGKTGDQTCLRARAAGGAHHMINAQPQIIGLRDEFDRGIDIPESAGRIRSPSRYQIRFAALVFQPGCDFCKFGIHVRIGRAMLDARTVQMIQQHIAAGRVIVICLAGAILEKNVAIDAHFRGASGGLARVIGLGRALCQHDVGTLISRFRHQVLEFSRLIAAGRHAGAIVALDPDFRPTQCAA